MSEMIERVAKVITDSLVEDGAVNLLDSTDEEGECHFHSSALLAARAAIAAMRKPTKEMIEVGATAIDNSTDETSDSYSTHVVTHGIDYALPGWQAMIDEALK